MNLISYDIKGSQIKFRKTLELKRIIELLYSKILLSRNLAT